MTSHGGESQPVPRPGRILIFLVAAWSALILAAFVLQNPFPVRARLAVETARDVLVALGMLVGASVAGRLLLRWFGFARLLSDATERLLASTALGYGCLGLVTLAAAHAGLLHPIPWLLASVALMLLARGDVAALERDLRDTLRTLRRGVAGGPARRALAVLLGLAMGLMLLEALAPPTAYDALRDNLRLPRIYADAGGWVDVPYDFSAAFPQNVDMLFALAFTLAAPGAASLTHM